MIYKVIKPFANVNKGDIFEWDMITESWVCEHIDQNEYVTDSLLSTSEMVYSLSIDSDTIDDYVEKGYLEEIVEDASVYLDLNEEKLNEVKKFIDSKIKEYNESYKNLMKEDTPKSCQLEASLVYENIMDVLNSVKEKIDE